MGFSPVEVDKMSMWQLLVTIEGWAEAHRPADGLSKQEADDLWTWLQEKPLPNGAAKR